MDKPGIPASPKPQRTTDAKRRPSHTRTHPTQSAHHRSARLVSARELVLDALMRINIDQAYSHLVLHQFLQKHQVKPADRRLVTEIVYGTISRLSTIDYFLGQYVQQPLAKLDSWVKCLLELSLYQLLYLDRVPDHAIVHEAVEIAKVRGHQGISSMVNGVLRNLIRNKSQLVIPEHLPLLERYSLIYSHPQWLIERWIHERGEQLTEQICIANNQSPSLSIRTNTMMQSREQLMEQLQAAGVEVFASSLAHAGIIVKSEGSIADIAAYTQGNFTIQDESSMLVAEVVDPQPGMNVLDCCAAPGGKTTHLAELMHDTGDIWACDIHAHKQSLIEQHIQRLHLSSIHTMVDDAQNLQQHFPAHTFDRILLDAPCSGFGVIRRKPDLKWKKQPQDLIAICAIQYQLLRSVASLLKIGGILVYSTCTIEKAENQDIIERFVSEHPNFVLAPFPDAVLSRLNEDSTRQKPGLLQIYPQDYHSDGFFIARLLKIDENCA